ncbi:MAG: tRNA 4-thiouridine(8) synthase ThiI [Coprobacillus sp.]|nr:tRNA 4-thiouridine(8) synthase ThiI [Coprobacillus sp.]
MANYDILMVRFGELSTKGKNKKDFIQTLYLNIKNSLKDFPSVEVEKRYDHIYVHINNENLDSVLNRLLDVSGIHSISLVKRVEKDIEVIKKTALDLIKEEEGNTFKIIAKRGDKTFPMVSDEINRAVATEILKNTSLKVDVHNPDIPLSIEIREEGAYLFCKTVPGLGGYPLGVGGRCLLMMSGGIDSPVAAYLLMKRGITIECVHFASPPYTSQGVIYKLQDLLHVLNRYQGEIRLNIVPFTEIQDAIYANTDESYCITLMRRMMYRISTELAKRRHCKAVANGESVGQVASQTLDSLIAINEVTNYPIIRPLATMDKLEIMNIATKIGTYDISIRPFEDCCTIFAPKNPKTAPKLDDIAKYEAKVDYDSLIKKALDNIEVQIIK